MGFDEQVLIWLFVACEVWCIADVSSVYSPSSDSLFRQRTTARNNSYTPNLTGQEHAVATLVDQTYIRNGSYIPFETVLYAFLILHI